MVLKWFKQFIESSRQTKLFVLNCILYTLLIVGTTVYCYARLDFVRSYKTKPVIQSENGSKST